MLILAGICNSGYANEPENEVYVFGRTEVIDGDTIRIQPKLISNSKKSKHNPILILLNNINAPEPNQGCTSHSKKIWMCGREATRKLEYTIRKYAEQEWERGLLPKTFYLVTCKGKYENPSFMIAQCFVGHNNERQVSLNHEMVKQGMAVATTRKYAESENKAKKKGIGIWSGNYPGA